MAAMIVTALAWVTGNRWALIAAKWGAIALTVLLFLLSIRRAGERAGRMAQRLENCNRGGRRRDGSGHHGSNAELRVPRRQLTLPVLTFGGIVQTGEQECFSRA